jgi:hypothetical protein
MIQLSRIPHFFSNMGNFHKQVRHLEIFGFCRNMGRHPESWIDFINRTDRQKDMLHDIGPHKHEMIVPTNEIWEGPTTVMQQHLNQQIALINRPKPTMMHRVSEPCPHESERDNRREIASHRWSSQHKHLNIATELNNCQISGDPNRGPIFHSIPTLNRQYGRPTLGSCLTEVTAMAPSTHGWVMVVTLGCSASRDGLKEVQSAGVRCLRSQTCSRSVGQKGWGCFLIVRVRSISRGPFCFFGEAAQVNRDVNQHSSSLVRINLFSCLVGLLCPDVGSVFTRILVLTLLLFLWVDFYRRDWGILLIYGSTPYLG